MIRMERYTKCFIDAFGVKPDVAVKLEYQSIPEWDSVGHMGLIAEIEDAFDIMMDTEDIIDLSSYEKGIEIVRKYGVEL